MDQEFSDIIIGGAGLLVFLAIAFVGGLLISKFRNSRYSAAWQPLIPLINGNVENDGGGAATSWLTGTYQGKSVYASMVPKRNRYSTDSNEHYNYFEAGLRDIPGKYSWRVEHQAGLLGLGIGKTGWDVVSENKALETKLRDAAIVEEISRFLLMSVDYSPQRRILRLSEDVTPAWIPPTDRVRQEFELLLRLESINAALNRD